MQPLLRRALITGAAITTGLAAVAASGPVMAGNPHNPAPSPSGQPSLVGGAFSDCFWYYGAIADDPQYNIAYPDAGATYWASYYRRPTGSTLTLEGTYPRSRYFSLISYDRNGQPVDGIADYQLPPDPGSSNPFRPGSKRNTKDSQRSYSVDVVHEKNLLTPGSPTTPAVPLYTIRDPRNDEPQRKDLRTVPTPPSQGYPGVPLGTEVGSDGETYDLELLLMRVYIPDQRKDMTGGVGLPQPKLTLADGTVLEGQSACDAMDSESKDLKATTERETRLPDPSALTISEDKYKALRYPNELAPGEQVKVFPPDGQPGTPLYAVGRQVADPTSFPAVFHPGTGDRATDWRAQYDRRYLLQLWTGDDAPGANLNPGRTGGGFFPNIHNNYIRSALHRSFGEVAVIRGKLPTAPATYKGSPKMGTGQVRYASFCMNESVYTTRVMDCVYDEEVPVDKKGFYTIATSSADSRPKTADQNKGVAWIEWATTGDGYKDPDFGWFQIRNMLPDNDFTNAVQDTVKPGDEAEMMGDYLPDVTYMSRAEFDNWMKKHPHKHHHGKR